MLGKRILITGIGVFSPIGIGKDQFWENLRQTKSAFSQVTLFDVKGLKVNIAGEVTNFNAKEILSDVNLRDVDRASILLSCAVKLAIDDASLKIDETNTKSLGIVTGTTFGSLYSISEFDKEAVRDGPEYVNPSVFPSTVGNSPSSRASIIFNVKGLNSTVSTGMCAALDAVEYATDCLYFERAKTIITGSVEVLSPQI
jgi:3-oxoacyl-[acyl-carrier-protein] synthase II